jgi:secreted trypsin-like serine protease
VTYIHTSEGFSCTASLIAPKRVLTAEHCVASENAADFGRLYAPSSWDVYVNRRNTTTMPGEHRKVTAVVVGHHWQIGGLNDVAILFLDQPVTDIPPAPIAGPNDWAKTAYAMGWGHINYSHDPNTYVNPTDIQAGMFTLASDAQCQSLTTNGGSANNYQPWPGMVYYPDREFCAYDPAGVTCITHGDSGGPMMIYINGQWEQIGVASHYPSSQVWGNCQSGTNVIGETWVAGDVIHNWINAQTNPVCPGAQAVVPKWQTALAQGQTGLANAQGVVKRDTTLFSRASARASRLRHNWRRHRRAYRAAQKNLKNARQALSAARTNRDRWGQYVSSTSTGLANAQAYVQEVCTG